MVKNESPSGDVAAAANILKESTHVMAFTGAGISTESGIPDFRSPGGLWERYDPSIYADYGTFLEHPEYLWELGINLFNTITRARPNPAHKALVDLERMEKLQVIVTQNIDRLHQKAGSKVPILELHGSYDEFFCIKCGARFSLYDIIPRVARGEKSLSCAACGGLLKPSAVMFGENLQADVVSAVEGYAQSSDCVIIIGCSLQVYPANQVPITAKRHGAHLIVVNQEHTYIDEHADIALLGKAGEILPQIIASLKEQKSP